MTGLVCDNCATPLPGGSKYCNEGGTPVPGQRPELLFTVGMPTDLRQALQMATAGEYEIHHELGRGGMGSVFLAREIGLDRLVAIKVLPPTLALDEGLIARFTREARMVAKLHHPNIIPVYRVHNSHNLAFYTMHFVSGRSLSEIMAAGGSLKLDQVEKVMLGGAAGLGYAHKRGVIHRDVKPANILVDAEGAVHLTDFGIAKALAGNTQLTETGAVIGTPQYMAPEQCDSRAVDGRADQYSLAIVGYQLLAGQPPFEAESMKELIYHHLFTPPKPLSELRSETPASLRDAIHKALSKDPSDRFDTMEDFQTALEGKGPPVFVKWIDGPSDRSKKKSRGRRATDLEPTEKLSHLPWTAAGEGLSGYRRAVAALAVAVLTIGTVGVLALTQGAGLARSLQQNAGLVSPFDKLLTLEAVDVHPQPDMSAGQSAENTPSQPEAIDPGSEDAAGPLATNGEDVSAAGLVAGDNEQARPVQIAQRPTWTDTRPALSREFVNVLSQRLNQGKKLYEMQLYLAAGEAFVEVHRNSVDALGQYRNSGALNGLIDEAEKYLEMARKECRVLGQDPCP
jgi:serine/threonine protein kinase